MCRNYELEPTPEEWKEINETLRVQFPPVQKTFFRTANFVPAVRVLDEKREASLFHWGLIPPRSKNKKFASKMVNACAETIEQKRSYRTPFLTQRCLMPATAFWEFREITPKIKEPHRIRMKDSQPFAFAAIWETWTPDNGDPIQSVSMITTEPNELIRRFHDRMPVILPVEQWDTWLGSTEDVNKLKQLLVSYPSDLMHEEIAPSPLKKAKPAEQPEKPNPKIKTLFD